MGCSIEHSESCGKGSGQMRRQRGLRKRRRLLTVEEKKTLTKCKSERQREKGERNRFSTAPFCRLMSTMRGSASSRKKFLFFSYSSSSIIFT